MKQYILFAAGLLAIFAASCSNVSGQSDAPTSQTIVRAETMPHDSEIPETAQNVKVGYKTVSACFDQCRTEIILSYSGRAVIEYPMGDSTTYAANVFQIEPGIWVAEIQGGQWIKIYSKTGTAEIDIDGQFRVFSPAR